ncbi:methyl-accepting chemotaxis protein [Candidatus Vecturithrix granuli]|uniref:Methyl-accepting chemotaxis protein n=1 Tax=Vecturithrix granuli TaxID=1499967 RepID=A0A081C9Q6_VECG1|nr:methyl-accepting chemotaxis protein [Candidatus Vecturithrix granuli]
MKSITHKMLVSFGLTAFASILLVGVVVFARITENISRQTTHLTAEMTAQMNASLNLPHQTFEVMLREEIQRDARELCMSSIVMNHVESGRIKALGSELHHIATALGLDYAVLINLDGRILTSFPSPIDDLVVEQYLSDWEFAKYVLGLLNMDSQTPSDVLYTLTFLSPSILNALRINDQDTPEKGTLSIVAAGFIKNDFDELLGIGIVGHVLNRHKQHLQNVHTIGGYASVIYLDTTAIAQAGFDEILGEEHDLSLLQISPEIQAAVYQASDKVNQMLTFAGNRYLTSCSTLQSFSQTKIGMFCVGLPESRIIQAQNTIRSTSMAMRKNVQTWIIGIGGASILIFLLLSWRIAIKMVTPLKQLALLTQQFTAGDLRQKALVTSRDEIGQLAAAFNIMLAQMGHIIERVRSVASNVVAGTERLNARSQQMAEGATEQAASAEEVSSSMEQMAANFLQNAKNAHQTEKIAVQAARDAQESSQIVAQTVTAIQAISQKISIVNDIARQTKLLSLNAKIEAARAQEYGQGFNVVASEVRALAEWSQNASEEINQLANSNIAIAEKAKEHLAKLVQAIEQTTLLIQEISLASNEQQIGTEHINKAIHLLNQVIQQNTSTAIDVAGTATELSNQAKELSETIAFFKITESL